MALNRIKPLECQSEVSGIKAAPGFTLLLHHQLTVFACLKWHIVIKGPRWMMDAGFFLFCFFYPHSRNVTQHGKWGSSLAIGSICWSVQNHTDSGGPLPSSGNPLRLTFMVFFSMKCLNSYLIDGLGICYTHSCSPRMSCSHFGDPLANWTRARTSL